MNKNESKYYQTSVKMNDALISMLEEKDFQFITIKDICNKAHVNRSTFYLHYQNLNDLLEEVIYNTNLKFNELYKDKNLPDIKNSSKSELIFIKDEFLVPYLSFIKENKKIYRAAKNNPNLFKADIYSKKVYKDIICAIFDRFETNDKIKNYIFNFYISGLSTMILNWCNNNCDLPIEEMKELIKGLVFNDKKFN